MSAAAEEVGKLIGDMRKRANDVREDVRKAGYTVTQVSNFQSRVESLTQMQFHIQDETKDITDRVRWLDMVITAIGMPWGRTKTDEIWSKCWTSWRKTMVWWKRFKSQIYLFNSFVIELEQLQTVNVEVRDKSGQVSVQKSQRWETLSVEAVTAVKMFLEQPQDEETVRILNVRPKAPTMKLDPDPAFTETHIHNTITEVGDIIIVETGLLILGYAWDQLDIPNYMTLVLQSMVAGQGVPASVEVRTQTEESEEKD